MRVGGLTVSFLLVILGVAGCLGNPPEGSVPEAEPPGSLEMVDEFIINPSTDYTFALSTVGWGRLSLNVTTSLRFEIELAHDEIKNPNVSGPDDGGIYDEKNFTTIAFLSDAGPRISPRPVYHYTWWGTPVMSHGPSLQSNGPIDLAPGDNALLLVATTVPGYNITLKSEEPDNLTETHEWHLGEHPDQNLFVPEPEDKALLNNDLVRAQRVRRWSHQESDVPPSIIISKLWTHYLPTTARVGVFSYTFDDNPQGDFCAAGMQKSGINTGHFLITDEEAHDVFTRTRYMYRTCDYHFLRHQEETFIGIENMVVGAAFLIIPLDPPSAPHG